MKHHPPAGNAPDDAHRKTHGLAPGDGRFRLDRRAAGVLLHVTSLPGPYGVGDVGPAAREFVDFLKSARQRWWQMLPVGPTDGGGCPYAALSAMAGNPLLISLDLLVAEGLLRRQEIRPPGDFPSGRSVFAAAGEFKRGCLERAYQAWVHGRGSEQPEFVDWAEGQGDWLDDYAMFIAVRGLNWGRAWLEWGAGWRRSLPAGRGSGRLLPAGSGRALPAGWDSGSLAAGRGAEWLGFERFLQYVFDRQWAGLRAYAHQRGVGLIGDIPIFVAHDSSDVWAHPELFDLDPAGRPRTVSGLPPDYFSRTGQKWGHPHYRWRRHAASGFAWWIGRFRRAFEQFDAVRIDHFLGFHRVWEVPRRAKTALRGRWVRTPGEALFTELRRRLGPVEIIAEDLGLLVPEAAALRDRFGFPGMRLLHFAFGAGGEYHRPHRHPACSVAYPGTHDNDTTAGWLKMLLEEKRASGRRNATADTAVARARTADAAVAHLAGTADTAVAHPRPDRTAGTAGAHSTGTAGTAAAPGDTADTAVAQSGVAHSPGRHELMDYDRLRRYAGVRGAVRVWDVLRLVLASPANLAIVPAQDLLGLGSEARMNTPGTADGNWTWRLKPGQLTRGVAKRLRELSEAYDRGNSE